MNDYKKIISAYDRFVPYKLLELLGKHDISEINLGDHVEKRVTILFADIRDFTTLSESITPQETFHFINSYLSEMEPLISANNGVIDKYIGDAIMAIFPESAQDAYNCAVAMLTQLTNFNNGRKRTGDKPINIGIGLNTGIAMIGAVGGPNRMESTVISDAVNLCSRIESLTKAYKVQLLISESTYNDLSDINKESARFVDRVLVKGKLRPQSIYEVFEIDALDIKEHKLATKNIFEEVLANYHYGRIDTAKKLLEEVLSENENDGPAIKYLERCTNYLSTGIHECDSNLSNRISWSEQFLIGEEDIDKQHKKLVNNSLSLIEAIENDVAFSEIDVLAAELAEISKKHFEFEENLMVESDYPLIENQILQHENYMLSFPFVRDVIKDESSSKIFKMFKVQIFLIDWLISHTLKEDQNLGKFLTYSNYSNNT